VATIEATRLTASEVHGQTSEQTSRQATVMVVHQATPLAVNCDLAHHPRNIESPPLEESKREATLGPPLQSGPVQLVPPLHDL
jgi:hypothetical protein